MKPPPHFRLASSANPRGKSVASDAIAKAFNDAIDSRDYRKILDVLDFIKAWDSIARRSALPDSPVVLLRENPTNFRALQSR
ncbi:MAG: hypothetical protein ACFB9N_14075 [Geitlerinemataceae cyanobacterium]